MPPKPALTKSERLKKELQAQQARAEALKHLHATGSGPSQSELTRQQAERQKLQNATSARVERFVTGSAPAAPTAADKYDPRVRDNTLHAVALRRANEIHQTQRTTQQLSAYRTDSTSSNSSSTSDLPDGWTTVPDPASGDVYYWNEVRCYTMALDRATLLDCRAHAARLRHSVRWRSAQTRRPGTVRVAAPARRQRVHRQVNQRLRQLMTLKRCRPDGKRRRILRAATSTTGTARRTRRRGRDQRL